ncbi:MAG: PLP-dependent aminotransferase family protein [Acidobacteria bacterium]|nr:PLP-dependent aminotransferase family protein [Acidobacteriota bacterium]
MSAIRKAILGGQIRPSTRLPSSRDLARQCAVSRNTVLEVYAQLTAEGYLRGQTGAGTFVTDALPDEMLHVARSQDTTLRLSSQGYRFAGGSTDPSSGRPGPFRPGVPAIDHFPLRAWSRLVSSLWRNSAIDVLGYDGDAGFGPLRDAIAAYVSSNRGVTCDPSQVIVVAGSQQALDLTARILVEPGDGVWIEDPVYAGARKTFASAGARLLPVPVDEDGMRVTEMSDHAGAGRIAYVTPSHQYPLGSTLSLERRLHLLGWAARTNGWIVEDDYDSEFRYGSRPLPALQGMDQSRRVIYVGTFSKILLPSIRIGYVIAPEPLIGAYSTARALSGRGSSVIEQAALAEFIGRGHLDRHLRRMRTLYAQRQGRLIELLRMEASDVIEAGPSEAGMHLIAWLPDGVSDGRVHEIALASGVEAPPLSSYMIGPMSRGALLLGYGAVEEEEMPAAVRVLAAAVRQEMIESGR